MTRIDVVINQREIVGTRNSGRESQRRRRCWIEARKMEGKRHLESGVVAMRSVGSGGILVSGLRFFVLFHHLSIRSLLVMTVIYVHEIFTASTDG